MTTPKIVSREEWLLARKQLLLKEKQLTRQRDELDRERRELPWVRVEKQYVFDGPNGKETLGELFGGRSQLVVSHFMLGPGWMEGCVGCSFRSDHVDGCLAHLEHHDVSLVTISRAPWVEIEPFQKRMGWRFKWVSSYGSDFNFDYGVSFRPEQIARGKVFYNYADSDFLSEELSGVSVFYKETGPHYNLGDWVRHHDRYEEGGFVDRRGRYIKDDQTDASCRCGGAGRG